MGVQEGCSMTYDPCSYICICRGSPLSIRLPVLNVFVIRSRTIHDQVMYYSHAFQPSVLTHILSPLSKSLTPFPPSTCPQTSPPAPPPHPAPPPETHRSADPAAVQTSNVGSADSDPRAPAWIRHSGCGARVPRRSGR